MITLQLVVYGLAEAVVTTTTTKKTCNDIDLFASSIGYIFLLFSL